MLDQEQLQLGPQAQTLHSPQPTSTYRVKLTPDVLDPVCHGLGHAIFRLALAMQSTQPVVLHSAGTQESSMQQQAAPSPWLETRLGTVAGGYSLQCCACISVSLCNACNHALLLTKPWCDVTVDSCLCRRGCGWLACTDHI